MSREALDAIREGQLQSFTAQELAKVMAKLRELSEITILESDWAIMERIARTAAGKMLCVEPSGERPVTYSIKNPCDPRCSLYKKCNISNKTEL